MAPVSARSNEIRGLEEAFLEAEVRADASQLEPLIADEFVEFGSSGRVWDKASVLKALPAESGLAFSLSGFVANELGPDRVHTTFRMAVRDSGSERHSLRSSIWILRSGRWQMLFHQGTPCDPPAA